MDIKVLEIILKFNSFLFGIFQTKHLFFKILYEVDLECFYQEWELENVASQVNRHFAISVSFCNKNTI